MINVVKPFFPPLEEYHEQLKRVWKNAWLTNRGPLVLELEEKIKKRFSLENMLITNNGTLPLQIALKLYGQKGEVITTPFSFIATTSAIVWESCTPVFVDIHPEYLTIDETKIEAAITPRTKAILATHVFGNPCDVEAIEKIAQKHKLKVIYDAAHCFNVSYKGKSVFHYGDLSTCSFHATKLFHTGEGGAIFCRNKEEHEEAFFAHNFGYDGPLTFHGVGINGKISELQAAMGLSVLPHIEQIITSRKKVVEYYDTHLKTELFSRMKIRPGTDWNYSYYAVVLPNSQKMKEVLTALKENQITARQYFCPSLNTVNFVHSAKMPISEDISSRIICLPLYGELTEQDLEKICSTVNATL